jgi:GNAT superfamily N-acetyltransferase
MRLSKLHRKKQKCLELSLVHGTEAVANSFLYILYNGRHQRPFGLIEDIKVAKPYRGQGIGSKLLKEMIACAREENCYKLVCYSRHSKPQVHQWYLKYGFNDWGREFRMDF